MIFGTGRDTASKPQLLDQKRNMISNIKKILQANPIIDTSTQIKNEQWKKYKYWLYISWGEGWKYVYLDKL